MKQKRLSQNKRLQIIKNNEAVYIVNSRLQVRNEVS